MRALFCVLLLSRFAAGQSPEIAVLGGPCLAKAQATIAEIKEWHGLVSRHSQELRRGNREAAIALAKKIVRARCSNEYWWLNLAESLVELNRPEEAIHTVEAFCARKSNAVDAGLHNLNSPLHRLLSSDVYKSSHLAATLNSDHQALEKRRTEAKARMAREPRPPVDYVAHGACPFECCGFGSWSVLEDTELLDSPGGNRLIGKAIKQQRVLGLTGEVHLPPLPVLVRFNAPEGFHAAPGSIVYLLDNLGEGYGHVWMDGKIVEAGIVSVMENCAFPGPACWGEFVNPDDAGQQGKGIWWVKVKTPSGTVGWTNQAGHFGDIDRCG